MCMCCVHMSCVIGMGDSHTHTHTHIHSVLCECVCVFVCVYMCVWLFSTTCRSATLIMLIIANDILTYSFIGILL